MKSPNTTRGAKRRSKLPPDPEGMNSDRALWAASAIYRFQQQTGTDHENALCDLLCDLMHWSDRNNFNFGTTLTRAYGHYEAETAEIYIG
jgi:hypothetical protein